MGRTGPGHNEYPRSWRAVLAAPCHRGGLHLAEGLPDARLVTLEGRYHLPDIRDLDRIVATITAFLSGPH